MITCFRRRSTLGPLLLAISVVALALQTPAAAGPLQESGPSGRRLRERIEARYEVVPLSSGVGLRPTRRIRDVRMIEITDGLIAIDGAPVTGRELRDRIGDDDARLILQVSYLDADERRALFGLGAAGEPAAPAPPAVAPDEPAPLPPAAPSERPRIDRRRTGERVQIFGGVRIDRDESVEGQVVAVIGSVHIDGEVTDQVVAVLGSVELGPDARVGGDVTSVGGRVRRAPGAEVRGNINEINLGAVDIDWNVPGGPWWMLYGAFHPFARTAQLAGTVFRLLLLALVGSIIVLVARDPVERVAHRVRTEPVKAAVVGLLAELLFGPVLILTTVILALTIVGLLLVPFLVVASFFVLLAGFTATAYTVGGGAAHRFGWSADSPYLRVCLGILIILSPLLLARLFGLAGGPFDLVSLLLVAVALLIEFVAWTIGLGGALIAMFERWRMSRSTTALRAQGDQGEPIAAPPAP